MEGNLTIGENAVDYEAGGLNIYTETEYIAQTWYDYKVQHNCAYTIYLQGTVYKGGGVVSDEPCITGVTVSYAYNGKGFTDQRLEQVKAELKAEKQPDDLKVVYGLYNVNKRLNLYYQLD